MKRNEFFKSTLAFGLGMMAIPQLASAGIKKTFGKKQPKIIRSSDGEAHNVLGDRMTFKLTGADTNGAFTLIEELNEPGTMIPMHVHDDEDEVFKVLEGQLELTVGGETTVLKAGDLAYGPKGVPHSWKVVGDEKARVILSVFPSGIEEMFRELGAMPPGPPDFEKVSEICGRYNIRFV